MILASYRCFIARSCGKCEALSRAKCDGVSEKGQMKPNLSADLFQIYLDRKEEGMVLGELLNSKFGLFSPLDFSTESWIHFIRCSVVQLFNNANMPYA